MTNAFRHQPPPPWAARHPRRWERYVVFRDFIDNYKMERGCVDCGWAEHPAALELDHRDPSLKSNDISNMFTYTHERLLVELAKCDVRCSNCHQIRSYELGHFRQEKPVSEADDWTLFSMEEFN